jgi:hypothetical protein
MSGHVQVCGRTDGGRDVAGEFTIAEASWADAGVELHLRPTGHAAIGLEELRLRLDAAAVTEILGAVLRFATEAELGVIE